MIRILAAISMLALTACAATPPPAAPSPQAVEAMQVYQDLKLQQVEQQMMPDNRRMTYGNAVVNCGLRSPQWLNMLQLAYARSYQSVLQQTPLTPDQLVQAKAYAEANIANPTPPPYICGRLANDASLPDLDYAAGVESLILISPKKKPS
jgi:hypothetical protein